MQKLIINIFGKSESGKGTLAKFIQKELREAGKKAPIIGFADGIKEACIEILGMPREVAFGDQETRKSWTKLGLTAREWQQKIGQMFREIHEDFWIFRWQDEVERLLETYDVVITADGRMDNETIVPRQIFREALVCNILVDRPGHTAQGIDNDHPTEAGIDELGNIDILVGNTSLAELVEPAVGIVDELLEEVTRG